MSYKPANPTYTSVPKVDKRRVGRPKKDKTDLASAIARVLKPEEILNHKVAILELISTGKCINLTAAADMLGLNRASVFMWGQRDPDFKELTHLAQEIFADALEQRLAVYPNFIPQMMILKGLRPQYRDNYHVPNDSAPLSALLSELRKLGQRPKELQAPSSPETPLKDAAQDVTINVPEPMKCTVKSEGE